MRINILKTREGKLKQKIQDELSRKTPSIENIMVFITEYEKDNLESIVKLKKEKTLELKRINGALKQTIFAHGPITKLLIGSASKRIHGALLNSTPKVRIIKRFLKWIKIKK